MAVPVLNVPKKPGFWDKAAKVLPAVGTVVGTVAGAISGGPAGAPAGAGKGAGVGNAIGGAVQPSEKPAIPIPQADPMQRRLASLSQGQQELTSLREGLLQLPNLDPNQRAEAAPVLMNGYIERLHKLYQSGVG